MIAASTLKQRKMFFALAKELGYDNEMIKNRAKAHFKKEHFNELTKAQMQWLIDKLQSKIDQALDEEYQAQQEGNAAREAQEKGEAEMAEQEAREAEQEYFASQGQEAL